jgi:mono/diheme cytochrome c family protein
VSNRSELSALVLCVALAWPVLACAGCVAVTPPTDTGDALNPVAPDSPTVPAGTAQGLAYDPDLRALFASDCVACHGGFRTDAGYAMTTYPQVMRAVRPGDASSLLVVVTQRNGSMYRFFSGSRSAKAQLVRDWVVTYQAAQTR